MKTKIVRTLTLLIFLAPVSLHAETLHVIVNKTVAISELDKKQIRKIFLGKPVKLPSGYKLTPIDINENQSIYKQFYEKVIGKSSSQIASFWARQVFNGKGYPPPQMSDAKNIMKTVAENKNYISYVFSDDLSDKIKIIYSIDI